MSPSRVDASEKPRVVALGTPKYIAPNYLAQFQEEFNYSVLEAVNRKQTKELLPASIAQDGPIHAFIIRMGTPPYEPFDEDLLSALVPGCRIITSASAGFNEFDVTWMAEKGIWFCNTVDAVAEATADIAMFLILAVLRNTTVAEKSARSGSWRAAGLVPARDPTGLTLGVVGMGSIGKVSVRNE
jgi:lactate dehydrogenase-like 2-hydroxyacid dehydrogenase